MNILSHNFSVHDPMDLKMQLNYTKLLRSKIYSTVPFMSRRTGHIILYAYKM